MTVLNSWPWFITRAAGLTSLALLVLIGVSGLLQATGVIYRVLSPLKTWALHRALGVALAISLALHLLPLLVDKFHPFTLLAVLVPFVSHLSPVTIEGVNLGSLWVALGVLALYTYLPLLLTSLFWIESRHRLWKVTHFLGYAMFALALLHGWLLGTDSSNPIIHAGYWILLGLLIAGVLHRLTRVGAVKNGLLANRYTPPKR